MNVIAAENRWVWQSGSKQTGQVGVAGDKQEM